MKSVNRQTKIIATVGPVTDSEEALRLLIKNGVDLFWLNMAHADHKWIQDVTRRIQNWKGTQPRTCDYDGCERTRNTYWLPSQGNKS